MTKTGRRRSSRIFLWMMISILALCAALHWHWEIYFLTHSPSLNALTQAIEQHPEFYNIEVGVTESYDDHGKRIEYDTYRFLNKQVVTSFPRQVTKKRSQSVAEIGAYCKQHGLSQAVYVSLNLQLSRLGIAGYDRLENGTILFYVHKAGITFGDSSIGALIYLPESPFNEEHLSDVIPIAVTASHHIRRLASHWYIADYMP